MKLALGDTDLKLGKVLTAQSLHVLHWVGRDMRQEDISIPACPRACLPACLPDRPWSLSLRMLAAH
jgi:hypothetical protein